MRALPLVLLLTIGCATVPLKPRSGCANCDTETPEQVLARVKSTLQCVIDRNPAFPLGYQSNVRNAFQAVLDVAVVNTPNVIPPPPVSP